MARTINLRRRGLLHGYRSGLEETVAGDLARRGVRAGYETVKIAYLKPERKATYTPDFILPNGIIVETKGRFLTADRQKHLLIKAQRPDLDIRFLFTNSRAKIAKGSRTSYADWCAKYGFLFADKTVPEGWLR